MANRVFNRGRFVTAQSDLDALTLIGLLVSTGFTHSATQDVVDDGTTGDPKSYEIGVSGYARQTLQNLAIFSTTEDFVGLFADDLTFSSLASGATVGGCVVYRYSTSGGTTSDTGQDLLAVYEVTATPTNGGDLSIVWASTSAGSVLKLGSTA